jgi:hypothetical protein
MLTIILCAHKRDGWTRRHYALTLPYAHPLHDPILSMNNVVLALAMTSLTITG